MKQKLLLPAFGLLNVTVKSRSDPMTSEDWKSSAGTRN